MDYERSLEMDITVVAEHEGQYGTSCGEDVMRR